MKRIATILIMLSFASMAVFGVLAAGFLMDGHGGCMASTATGDPCPMSIAALLSHHISAFQAFFLSVPPALSLLVIAAAALAVLDIFLSRLSLSPPRGLLSYFQAQPEDRHSDRVSILRWLSLFELSPSF